MTPIYLDYNATTPIDPEVLQTMLPYLKAHFGNASSSHLYGKIAHRALDQGRQHLADLIGASSSEILFTSNGTEATNHALKGTAWKYSKEDCHIITSAVEHPATAKVCDYLQQLGYLVTVVPVDRFGLVDPDDVRKALTKQTKLITIMHSNNEVGTIEPIREIAEIAHQYGALMHTDVAQSLGKVAIDVNDLGVDLLTIAGHKLYAPKGIGALYLRRGVQLTPLIHGAGHENDQRAGTENIPSIVALGEAAKICEFSLPEATHRLRTLRDRLHSKLQAALGDRIVLNGHPEKRLPNTLNVSFLGHNGSELLDSIPGIAASTGSACHAGTVTESPVLRAMKVSSEVARGTVRLSVGRFTTEEEIDRAAELIIAASC